MLRAVRLELVETFAERRGLRESFENCQSVRAARDETVRHFDPQLIAIQMHGQMWNALQERTGFQWSHGRIMS